MVEALVFRRTGALLTRITPTWESVVWRLNGIGMAKFTLAYTDSTCTPDILCPGNRLLVRFDNGLPDWGGVLDLPRRRTADGVGVTAYSGEYLLSWRRTAKGRYFNQRAPGLIYAALINEANAIWPTGVTPDYVYAGGVGRSPEYHYHDLLARVQDLQSLSGYDWVVLPRYNEGTLTFLAYWYQRRGSDLSQTVHLVEGLNAEITTLDEQGPLYNAVRVVGQGTTWGDERPVSALATDTDSIVEYGYREQVVFTNAVEQNTLDASAGALLAASAKPRARLTVVATDREPGRFKQYDVGDTVTVRAFLRWPNWTYETAVRVLAREWTPAETCRLEVE